MAFSIVRQCVSNVKTYIAAVCFKLMDSLSFYIMETLLFFSGKKKLHSFYLFFHSRELKSVSYRYVISLISIATFKGEKYMSIHCFYRLDLHLQYCSTEITSGTFMGALPRLPRNTLRTSIEGFSNFLMPKTLKNKDSSFKNVNILKIFTLY